MSVDLRERRERVFIALAGVFLCAMTLLNVVGITRFVQLGPMSLAVGVLPYPITFLVTDLISELYGRARANYLVTVGLCLNAFILLCLWLGNLLPGVDPTQQPPWQTLQLAEAIALPSGELTATSVDLFALIYACTSGAVVASMLAYMAAQYCDVQLFHFFKRLTNGRHLWLRNNASTMISQAVDSVVVIGVTFGAAFLSGSLTAHAIAVLLLSNYFFKVVAALLDTLPFYFLTARLQRYLQLEPAG